METGRLLYDYQSVLHMAIRDNGKYFKMPKLNQCNKFYKMVFDKEFMSTIYFKRSFSIKYGYIIENTDTSLICKRTLKGTTTTITRPLTSANSSRGLTLWQAQLQWIYSKSFCNN